MNGEPFEALIQHRCSFKYKLVAYGFLRTLNLYYGTKLKNIFWLYFNCTTLETILNTCISKQEPDLLVKVQVNKPLKNYGAKLMHNKIALLGK